MFDKSSEFISSPVDRPQRQKDIEALQVELRQFKTSSQDTQNQINPETLASIEDKSLDTLLRNIVDRLKQEPKCPKDALEETVAIVTERKRADFKSDVLGQYHTFSGKITLGKVYKPWKSRQVIEELLRHGVDQMTTTIHHEQIHAYQASPRLHEILTSARRQLHNFTLQYEKSERDMYQYLLQETQAHIAADHLTVEQNRQEVSSYPSYKAFLHVTTSRVSPYEGHLLLMDVGAIAIKRLYALGHSDRQIAELVRASQWDTQRKGFDLLEDRISQEMNIRGSDMNEVDDLVKIDEIKWEIYLEKAKKVAQEEILKYVQHLNNP